MSRLRTVLFLIAMMLFGCGQPGGGTVPRSSELTVLGPQLQQLKDDFNANQGKVRLIFLNGPTCGICLRGMADLNDAFLAESQNDVRVVTFVVHVPTMGAKEQHAVDAMPLLDGPQVKHYWEETGIIGQHYTDVMDVDVYVWDFWAIYGPDHLWHGTLPPVPDYYEHQLGSGGGNSRGFPHELRLDADRFAAETRRFVDQPEAVRLAGLVETTEQEILADGPFIPTVGQPRSVPVRQHIVGRGGYGNLKRISQVVKHGTLETGGETYDLAITATRPDKLRREVRSSKDGVSGLPDEIKRILQDSFEFDGLLVEWPDKGHELVMSGMLKIGDVLAWRLRLAQYGGPNWHLFIDSHSGALVRADVLNDEEEPEYSIRYSDFREVSGFSFPFRTEYFDSADERVAVEEIELIDVQIESPEIDKKPVTP